MAGIELAAVALGAAVVKSASRIWLGDHQFAADMSGEVVDLLAGRVTNAFDQRRVKRFFDECADIVGKRAAALLDAEFRDVPENERQAALLAVADTFNRSTVGGAALFQADLDARLLERQLGPTSAAVLRKATLSMGGEAVYTLVLRESCTYAVEVVTTLPKFEAGALTEVLRRETAIIGTLRDILDRLPERRGVDDFAADYNRVVANKLDRLELLGVTLAEANRRYPLSVAYISLSVVRLRGGIGQLAKRADIDPADGSAQRIESVLGAGDRVLIMGAAGSGKTTLLQWLAVRSARGDFGGPLTSLNGTVPFFLPLRRYVDQDLPAPERFPQTVGAHIANDMPQGWVHDLLRTGRALILVDGVDEMPDGHRDRVRRWLADLVETFPASRVIVTSRPTAIQDGWLDRLRFTTTELQPMSTSDIGEFIHQWHTAVGADLVDADERADLDEYERSLLAAIDTDRHLRALTVSPLLCALICALNRERRAHLPTDRMETYSAALDMLLDRRDRERGVLPGGLDLSKGDKVILLQDIAFWLVRNGWSSAPDERVIGQISRSVQHLRGIAADSRDVYRSLLERSGLIREPAAHQVDFVHRTFQEYLAGKAAAENDEIGLLVKNAHDDQWREVVVMAAGHARPDQCNELLRGLLRRGRPSLRHGSLAPLAVVAAQSARRIDPRLRAEIGKLTEELVPPSTDEVAEALADTGDVLLTLLRDKPPRTIWEAKASIHAVTKIGGHAAMALIAEILASQLGAPPDQMVTGAVINAWRFFKPDEYVTEVLARSWPLDEELPVSETAFLAVLHLFAGLRAVSLDMGGFDSAQAVTGLNALARNRELQSVALDGCPDSLDLRPLPLLQRLEKLSVRSRHRLPDISPLISVPELRELALVAGAGGEALRAIGRLPAVRSLLLDGFDDVVDLTALADLPPSVSVVTLSGFAGLRSIDGAERWDAVDGIEFFGCPRLSDLGPIAGMRSLRSIGIGLLTVDKLDLTPLAELPRLAEVALLGHAAFDLSGLRGKPNVTVHVPFGSRILGAGELGPGSKIAEFTDAPRLPGLTATRGELS